LTTYTEAIGQLHTLNMLLGDFEDVWNSKFKHLQETVAILMHHDAISATSRKVAIDDFFLRIKKAFG
jgi:hypothetical protein